MRMKWIGIAAVLAGGALLVAAAQVGPTRPDGEFVTVDGGSFRMGDEVGDLPAVCRPVHEVRLDTYRLGARLVTWAEIARVFNWAAEGNRITITQREVLLASAGGERLLAVSDTPAVPAALKVVNGRLQVVAGHENEPCVGVSWYGAAAFCNFRSQMEGLTPSFTFADWRCDTRQNGYRLPSEAEYEYAARNRGRTLRYPWGDGAPQAAGKPLANVADDTGERHFAERKITWRYPLPLPWPGFSDGFAATNPVGAFPPSPLGLCDIAGNVWEFCLDWFGPYSAEAQVNPTGPATGERRCMRGGSWMNPDPQVFRCAYRDEDKPDFLYIHAGFRLARSVPASGNGARQE